MTFVFVCVVGARFLLPLLIPRYPLPAIVACLVALSCSGTQRTRVAGAYRFECDPPDARVIMDEVDQGPCALWASRWLGVGPGPHRLQVVREHYLPQESDLVPQGRRVVVRVQLRREPD